MEEKELFNELGEFFKIFADTTRIRILNLLTEKECCVSEIVDELDVSQSAVSHQLQMLRYFNVVKTEKKGQTVIYSLADEHIHIILKYGIEHIKEKNK